MIIVTSGIKFIDLDGLASAVSYADLLKLQHREAAAVLAAPLNHSVTKTIKEWGADYSETLKYVDCDFVLVDVSEASHFPSLVDQNKILEIYDHHFGFEDFWKERLGERAIIEPVGACATLIWEQYRQSGQEKNIKTVDASLLANAIVSNTLNFRAAVTTPRDITAYNELQPYIGQKGDWVRQYFEEQEDGIYKNVIGAILKDTKVQSIPKLKIEMVMGQLELWDSRQFVEDQRQEIQTALTSYNNDYWFLNCPSISENKTYLYTTSEATKDLLSKTLNIEFYNDVAETNRLFLRKEILKELHGIQQGT
jgi:inorganic pyrophosphatase/exopolyphosphatase